MTLIVVSEGHELRAATEQFISRIYATHYGAVIPSFPPMLIAMTNAEGGLLCASGLRFATDGFFSEVYLDIPVEKALTEATGQRLSEVDIFEVTTFASNAPRAATRFLRQIVAYGGYAGFDWAFFTATDRLRALLRRLELPFLTLSAADPARLQNSETWGSYYMCGPHVCAVGRDAAHRFLIQPSRGAVHA